MLSTTPTTTKSNWLNFKFKLNDILIKNANYNYFAISSLTTNEPITIKTSIFSSKIHFTLPKQLIIHHKNDSTITQIYNTESHSEITITLNRLIVSYMYEKTFHNIKELIKTKV